MTTGMLFLCLGGASGLLSGLLGIGGGVVLLPALLYVLPLLGGAPLTPFFATEISMIQVAVSSLTGILIHRPHAHVPPRRLVLWAGSALLGGGAGGLLSYHFSGKTILALFLAEAVIALLLLRSSSDTPGSVAGRPRGGIEWVEVVVMAMIGLTSGILGVGGGFLFYPVLTVFFGYSSIVAVGSSLAVMFPMAAAASALKIWASGTLPSEIVEIVPGALIGAFVGARFSPRLGSAKIRLLQSILLGLTILRVGWGLIFGTGKF